MNTLSFNPKRFLSQALAAIIIVSLLLTAMPVQAADTGFQNPTSNAADTGGDGNGFQTTPANAYADGGGNAANDNGPDDRHRYWGYNFGAIPAGSTIDGIEVRLDWWVSSTSGNNTMRVELSWNGGTTWTAAQTATNESTSEVTAILGGPTNTWGHTWTVSELSNLRVRITSLCSGDFFGCPGRDFFLDWVPVRVSYTVPLPPTTTALTSSLNPSLPGQSVTFTATVTAASGTPTGTVTFQDGGTPIGSGTLDGSGVATFSTSALAVGAHNITAVYGGDSNFGGSTSPVLVQNVNQAPAITSADATTFSVGTAGNFTVTATGNPAPTFTLTGDTLPAGVNFDTNTGVFSGTPASGTVGVYNFLITAGNGIAPNATQNFTLTVIKGDQTINFPQPASPQQYGSTFTINATASSGLTVSVIATGGCTLAGNVVTMTSGTVACTLTASQAGDDDYNAAPNVERTVAASRASTTVSVSPSPHTFLNPSQSFYSHPMTFSIAVTSAGGIPTGTVTLTGGTPAQNFTATLDAFGQAEITTSSLNMNAFTIIIPHDLDFTYNGDADFNPDTENVQHVVYPAPTQVEVTSNINPSAEGELVTFTVTVSTTPPGSGTPLGTVTLWDGSTQIGASTVLVGGVATFDISTLAFGSHNISARYTNTSDNFATSNNTANPYVQNVRRATTTNLTSNNNPSVYGENVTFTATVTSSTPGAITGTVTFMDGATVIGSDNSIVGGVATFTTNALVVGSHPITAVYSGNGTFATSTSAVLNQVVDQATLTVTADDQTITYGDSDPPFTFQYSGFVLGDDANDINTSPSCTVSGAHVDVGTYPIVCLGAADNNYTFTYVDGALTVSPKALTITAQDQIKDFNTPFSFSGTEFTATGLIFGDTVASVTLVSTGAPQPAPVGTYSIDPSNAMAAVGTNLSNYTITYISGTMTVIPASANPLIITAIDQTKTYGDVFTFDESFPGSFTVSGLVGSDTVTSITLTSAGAPSAADVGTYNIVPSNAQGTGLSNYTIVYVNGTMDVSQRNLTFNPNNQSKIYGDLFSPLDYTGTFTGLCACDDITPIYTSLGEPATATVGVYDITVTLDDPDGRLGNYIVTIDSPPTATLTVNPRSLIVTPDDQSKIYGDVFTAFTGTVTGIQNGDNITATYDSLGAPATADVGPYDIDATLVDTGGMLGNYAITLNTGTLTVTERDLVAISDSQSKVYGAVFTAFTGSFIGIQNGDNITATYDSAGAPATAPFGTYPITITLIDPDNKLGNYNVTETIGTLTVTRRDLSFVPDDQSKIYGAVFTAFTGTVTGIQNSDNITPIYASPGAIATAPVGDYPITITLNDPDDKLGNYNFTIGTATLTVTERDLIVTPDDQSKQYGTWFITFTGTITGIQNGDNITANYASAGSPPSAPVGSYPITATLNDPTGKLGNYNVILDEGTLTVSSSGLTITAENKTITYGQVDPDFTFTYFGFAAGDTPAVIDTPPTCTVAGPHTDVGTYPIVCSGGVDDAYTFTYIAGTFTVTPRTLTVIPGDKTKVYGDVFTAFTGTITGLQFTDVITATYASTGAPATAAIGDYPITTTLVDPGNRLGNYTVNISVGTLTVTQRALTVTPADKTKIYGDVFTLFTGTITGIQNGEAITATYSSPGAVATATVAGSPYPITAVLNAPAGVLANYSIILNTGELTVTPRALSVTPDNKSKLFGTVFTAFTGTITGIQNGDAITATYASTGAPAAALSGSYPITATVNAPVGVLANYTVTLNQGTLTVGSSVLTVTANNQTITYGDPDPAFTFTYSGFAPGDTPAVIDTPPTCQVAVPHNNVGTFPITCSGGIDDNYIFSYAPGTLTVTPRALTVTPNNNSKAYGDTFTAFTGVITGIQGGDNITATYTSAGAPATAAVGAYTITAALNDPGNRLGNYTVTLNTGTLTVTTRALLVTPTDASKIYGNVFTAFTGTITGIQNGDAITATYASPGAAAVATVGTYPITATLNAPAGVLANYTVTSNTGTLTVTQRDLTVIPADKTKVYGTVFTAFTGSLVGIQNSDNITATYSSPGAPAAADVGDYPITATLNDPNGRLGNYNVSLNTGTLTVNQATTTTAVTSDNNPSGLAELVNFTATVTSTSGTPTGTVTFFDGANSLGTFPLAGGVATFSTSTLTAGQHSITVVYGGDANFSGNTSAPYIQGVGQTVTTTVVTSNLNPSAFGQSVTFTAIVSSTTGIPTGTVSFNEGATVLGTGTLAGGVATFSTSGLTTGIHNITANYGGDTDFFGSVSAVLVQTVGPDTSIDSNPPDPDSDTTPAFTFSSTSATATFACRMDGGGFSPCNSGDTFGPLAAGNHTFEVRSTDSSGNVDPSPASYTWTIDTSAPNTAIDSNPPASTIILDATFTFSSPDLDVVGFECRLDGGGFTACTSPQDYTNLSGGSHTFEVRAVDNAGNVDPSPASYTWVIDLGFPVVLFNGNTTPGNNSTVGPGPTQVSVAFSEAIKNDGSAGAANNTANFLLVEDGVNDTFDTLSCVGGLVADDVQIPMTIPVYTNGTGTGPFIARSIVNGGTRLPLGNYRLFVCGTTSIEDLAGNELNDGLSDTTITFTVVPPQDNGGGGGNGGGNNGGNNTTSGANGLFIPVTGFPQGKITELGVQPADKAYAATDLWLEVPRLGLKMSIVGVPQTNKGWDVSWLGGNAGWLNGSAFPTWNGNSVITAHAWEHTNKPGPFAGLVNLKYGDQIKVHAFGQVYIYEIVDSSLILPSNTSAAFKHEEKPWLTLITCENYIEDTDTYTHRRMIRAALVRIEKEK